MTKSEIITELKQCKGDWEALEFAMKFIAECATCSTCKYYYEDMETGDACKSCDELFCNWKWED